MSDRFDAWLHETEERHLADLTFSEVSRSLRALSATYVERRNRLGQGAALSGNGKRAAFALFYGPLHFLLVRHVVRSLGDDASIVAELVDLGCGTGASGAAWATACRRAPAVVAVDRHPWAVEEARHTHRAFGLRARVLTADLTRAPLPAASAVLAAFSVNELDDSSREKMLERLLSHARRGGRVLVLEPLAGFVAPWWRAWQTGFERAGGRADEWRFRPELPAIVAKLDRAAGLHHAEVTGRSL